MARVGSDSKGLGDAGYRAVSHVFPWSLVRQERRSADDTVAVSASVAKTDVKSIISVKGSRLKRVPSVVR